MKKNIITGCLLLAIQISFAQNVGIGTTTPTKGKLEVVGVSGSGNTNAVFGTSSSGISLQQNWPTIGFNQYRDNTSGNGKFMSTGYAVLQTMSPANGTMVIDMLGTGTANTTTGSGNRALTLLANGNVGIHSDGSSATLTVSRGTGNDGTARLEGTNYTTYFNYGADEDIYIRAGKATGGLYLNDFSNSVVSMGFLNSKVGINVVNPSYTLHIREVEESGTNKGIALISLDNKEWELRNSTTFYFFLDGQLKSYIEPASGTWHAVSDERLKKNFHELPGVLDRVMQLHPLEYEMISNLPNPGTKTGFIAQEVKDLFPNLVKVFDDPQHKLGYSDISDLHVLDYSGFGVLAVKAIQEQQVMIKELEKRVQLLEEENKALVHLPVHSLADTKNN